MKINHVLVQTTDLNAMTEFFIQVTGLKEGFRPSFPFRGTWLYSNDKPILHPDEITVNQAQDDYLGVRSSDVGVGAFDHVALEGADYSALINRLHGFGIAYTERTVPLTKEHQVFMVGPDNVKVEMIFNQDKGDLHPNSNL